MVARGSINGACGVGVRFVIVNGSFFRDGWGAAVFVDGDVVREDVAPSVVGIVGDVAGGVGYDAAWPDRADVVAFSVIIPRYDLKWHLSCVILYVRWSSNLDKLRPYLSHLLPSSGPQIIASCAPVLVILWEVCIKPGRDSHHIWLPSEGSQPIAVVPGVFCVRPMRPGIPAKCSVNVIFGDPARTTAGPIGDEETIGLCLDVRPLRRTIGSLERRHNDLIVVPAMSIASFFLEKFDRVDNSIRVPRATRKIVKR